MPSSSQSDHDGRLDDPTKGQPNPVTSRRWQVNLRGASISGRARAAFLLPAEDQLRLIRAEGVEAGERARLEGERVVRDGRPLADLIEQALGQRPPVRNSPRTDGSSK